MKYHANVDQIDWLSYFHIQYDISKKILTELLAVETCPSTKSR